jgi:hypothetical protein
MMRNGLALSRPGHDGNTSDKFVELALKIVEYAHQAGCAVRPLSYGSAPYFSAQTAEKKRDILSGMQVFVEICQLTLANGKKLDDARSLIWYGLSHLEMRFTSDLFDKITDGDIVEVYTSDNIQILRNFKFFEYTSYTIEDVYCRPWTDLFIRHDLEKASETLAVMKKMITKEISSTISLEYIGTHKIEEALSPFKYQYDYTIKYLSPLYDRGRNPLGYIMIESAKILNPVETDLEKERLLKNYYRSHPIGTDIGAEL